MTVKGREDSATNEKRVGRAARRPAQHTGLGCEHTARVLACTQRHGTFTLAAVILVAPPIVRTWVLRHTGLADAGMPQSAAGCAVPLPAQCRGVHLRAGVACADVRRSQSKSVSCYVHQAGQGGRKRAERTTIS